MANREAAAPVTNQNFLSRRWPKPTFRQSCSSIRASSRNKNCRRKIADERARYQRMLNPTAQRIMLMGKILGEFD
jgi:hypothetical protein